MREWTMEEYLFSNLGGLDPQMLDIDLDRGPRLDAPYLEQQASTAIYIGSFLYKKGKLNIIVKCLYWQARHKTTNIAMDELFKSLCEDKVPANKDSEGNDIVSNMPTSRQEAKKVMQEVGFDYITIDACPCNQTLYYGEEKQNLQNCPI